MTVLRNDLYYPGSLVVDGVNGKLFWLPVRLERPVVGRPVRRANLDGSEPGHAAAQPEQQVGALALDVERDKLYYSEGGAIRRVNLDGSDRQDVVTGLGDMILGLSIDHYGEKVYWRQRTSRGQPGRVSTGRTWRRW